MKRFASLLFFAIPVFATEPLPAVAQEQVSKNLLVTPIKSDRKITVYARSKDCESRAVIISVVFPISDTKPGEPWQVSKVAILPNDCGLTVAELSFDTDNRRVTEVRAVELGFRSNHTFFLP